MSGLFEALDLDTSMRRQASRSALAVANVRAQKRFATFINQGKDRQARFNLIASDLQQVVIKACQETGHNDPEGVYHAVVANLGMPKVARRPKMCPYHRELTDMSLALGDPSTALSSMNAHAFGEASCRGSFDGSCNWKSDMLTQSYWDKRQDEADQRAQDRVQQEVSDITNWNAEQAEPSANDFEDEFDGSEEYEGPDINEALEAAPSAVGQPELVMAKKKKKDYQEGNVCSSCSSGHCSGCSDGNCSCGNCGGGSGGSGSGGGMGGGTASVHASDEKWIQKAVKRPGQLHKDLGVPEGEKIPESKLEQAEHSDNPKIRERAQFAENVKGLHKGAIPGAHDPNYVDPYAEEGGYGEEGGLDELIAALQLEYPHLPYEQLLAMAEQQAGQGPPEMATDPMAMSQDYGEPMYSSVHRQIKAERDGDSIEEHMAWPAQNGGDKTPTGLSTTPPVKMDPKTWSPANMPKLEVDKPNGMHNTVQQDITQPTEYTGDAFTKDDHRFDSFKNPSKMETLPAAGDDETRLGDSGFAGNNMDNPQSTGDVWSGMERQTDPVNSPTVPNTVMGSFLSLDEVQRAVRAFKG